MRIITAPAHAERTTQGWLKYYLLNARGNVWPIVKGEHSLDARVDLSLDHGIMEPLGHATRAHP